MSLLPLITIDCEYAHENVRQLVFLMESIHNLETAYQKNNTPLNVLYGHTKQILEKVIQENDIGMIVASASYTRFFDTILREIAVTGNIPVILIDDASVLPPWIASDHEEYAAYTLRKKYWS